MKPEQNVIRIVKHVDKIIFNSKKFDIRDTVVITGTLRSGTTWLMEILGVIPGYICLFEPFNPIYFPESMELGFESRKYLPPDVDWLEGEKYLRKIFTCSLQPDKN